MRAGTFRCAAPRARVLRLFYWRGIPCRAKVSLFLGRSSGHFILFGGYCRHPVDAVGRYMLSAGVRRAYGYEYHRLWNFRPLLAALPTAGHGACQSCGHRQVFLLLPTYYLMHLHFLFDGVPMWAVMP